MSFCSNFAPWIKNKKLHSHCKAILFLSIVEILIAHAFTNYEWIKIWKNFLFIGYMNNSFSIGQI